MKITTYKYLFLLLAIVYTQASIASQTTATTIVSAIRAQPLPSTQQQRLIQEKLQQLAESREGKRSRAQSIETYSPENGTPSSSCPSSSSASNINSPIICSRTVISTPSPASDVRTIQENTPLNIRVMYQAFPTKNRHDVVEMLYHLLTEFPADLACIVTSYLNFETSPMMNCTQTMRDHTDKVNALVYISDTLFASVSHDKTAKIWALQNATWNCIANLAHDNPVICILVLARNTTDLPSGIKKGALAERLATGTANGKIIIWHRQASKSSPALKYNAEHTLEGYKKSITALALLQEEPRTFVSASEDGTMRLWQKQNTTSWKCLQDFSCNGIPSALVATGGNILICGMTNGCLASYKYDNTQSKLTASHSVEPDEGCLVTTLISCPSGNVISCGFSGSLHIWDPETLTHFRSISINQAKYPLSTCAILPNGILAIAEWCESLNSINLIPNPETSDIRQITSIIEPHNSCIQSLIPLGKQMASCSADNTIKLWEQPCFDIKQKANSKSSCIIA